MSIMRFPNNPESSHPQYLWNEHEYIMRMLNQHRIGIGMEESLNSVIVYLTADKSINMVANGPVDYPSGQFFEQFSTATTQWIYLKSNGVEFYSLPIDKSPEYNQYLHGWYHKSNGDRCVVLINNENPAGQRCVIMDSFNAVFDFNNRIPDTGGDVIYNYNAIGNYSIVLSPGRYRIEICGGKGGKGGDVLYLSGSGDRNGGVGAVANTLIFKISIPLTTTLSGYVGGDGADGGNGNMNAHYDHNISGSGPWYDHNEYETVLTSGGGGSSGEDSYLMSKNILLMESIGGAGGGGAYAIACNSNDKTESGNYQYKNGICATGPGGGGAGVGQAEPGGVFRQYRFTTNAINWGEFSPAQPGTIDFGGEGRTYTCYSSSYISYNVFQNPRPGENGQNRGKLRRRNGGNSPQAIFNMGNLLSAYSSYYAYAAPSLGGNTIKSTTSGFIKIYKTGNVA